MIVKSVLHDYTMLNFLFISFLLHFASLACFASEALKGERVLVTIKKIGNDILNDNDLTSRILPINVERDGC